MTSVGIDARAAAEVPAGRGRFVRELLRALAERDDDHRYFLYARDRWEEPLDERFSWRTIKASDPLWNLRAARRASRECNVFFSTNSYLTAWFTTVPTALNIFDLIAWEVPAEAQRRAAAIERATIGAALRRAASVICNAESTRRDLLRRWPTTNAKTAVVPLAASPVFLRERTAEQLENVRRHFRLERPFVLAVGTIEPRKNLGRLVEAFVQLPSDQRSTYELAVVGPRGWDDKAVVSRLRSTPGVVLLGRVSDEDLAALYRLCELFCYPTLYEGFGLPVVEAMSSGAAVVTSNVSSLPEVAQQGAAYVDPREISSIRDGIARLLASPEDRATLRHRAKERAAMFSWAATAEQVLRQLAGAVPSTRS